MCLSLSISYALWWVNGWNGMTEEFMRIKKHRHSVIEQWIFLWYRDKHLYSVTTTQEQVVLVQHWTNRNKYVYNVQHLDKPGVCN